MLTFKLSRRGKKKKPTYRLVVVDKKKNPWGAIKEDVGSYNSHTKKVQFKVERIKHWLSKGAQPSLTVHNLLVKEKIIEAPKKKIKIKSSVAKVTHDKKIEGKSADASTTNSIPATESKPTNEIMTKTETPTDKNHPANTSTIEATPS